MSDLKTQIDALLQKVAEKQNIKNYELVYDVDARLRGDGFLGEFFLATIKNKDTNEVVEVAIKKALEDPVKREEVSTDLAYETEIYFYSEVVATFNRFQTERKVSDPFVEVAKYFCGTRKEGEEALALENLKAAGYVLWQKEKLMDDEHASIMFRTYAKYHALSYALRDQQPETYAKLVDGLPRFLLDYLDSKDSFRILENSLGKEAIESLEKDHPEIRKHCAKYEESTFNEIRKVMGLKSAFPVIAHGDAWSNNFMFRYNKTGKLESMKIVDFQGVSETSPVRDLSYFFYSGSSPELFEKLDDYLQLYHNTLLKMVKELGCDPKNIISLDDLKKEWKLVGKFGILISFLIMKVKLMNQEQVQSIVADKEEGAENLGVLGTVLNMDVNKELWTKRVTDIILHGYKFKLL